MAADTYAVKISTTDQQMESFSDLVVIEAEQAYEFNSRTLDLSAYAGQDIYIAFVNQTSGGYFLALDDVYISNSDNCYAPQAQTFTSSIDAASYIENPSANGISFTVGWEDMAEIANYDVGVTTFDIPVTSDGIQSSNFKTYTDMELGTRYQMFVKNADCGSGWMGPKSIFTPTDLPYSHGFEPTAENYGEYDSDGWTSDTWLMGVNSDLASIGEGYMFSNTTTTTDTNKWLYSYPFIIRETQSVKFTFAAAMATDAQESGVLKFGLTSSNHPNTIPEDFVEINVVPGEYQDVEYIINVNPGIHYFAFGNITPQASGSYALRIDSFNIEQGNLATSEVSETSDIAVYPNPVKDIIKDKAETNINTITLFDLNGKLLQSQGGINRPVTEINMNSFKSGLYFMQVETVEKTVIKKILKE